MEIAIITGASSGLGWEFTKQLKKFFHVDEIWVIARRKERLQALAKEVNEQNIVPLPLDLMNQKDLKKLETRLKEKKPSIKVLINNAGFGKRGNFNEIPLQQHLNQMHLNMDAVVSLTYQCLPYMPAKANILQVASVAGFIPFPKGSVYAASKAFVLSFSTSLAAELKPRNILVTAVCPGPAKTEFFDVFSKGKPIATGPLADPKKVVAKALTDAKNGKWTSVYGFQMKFGVLVSKLLPRKWLMGLLYGLGKKRF